MDSRQNVHVSGEEEEEEEEGDWDGSSKGDRSSDCRTLNV